MTIHYHGTPITPNAVLAELAGRNFCVSFARPDQVELAFRLGQSVMLDNGAYSHWRLGTEPDWQAYGTWARRWLDRYPTSWAVVPDEIEGDEAANDLLIARWPRDLFDRSAPVWHMHESLDRLRYLTQAWTKVCIGSSGQYATIGTSSWHRRIEQAMNTVCAGERIPWLHMLRGMAMVDEGYPFASVDSTDIGRNHNRDENTAPGMATRWDAIQCAPAWTPREQLSIV